MKTPVCYLALLGTIMHLGAAEVADGKSVFENRLNQYISALRIEVTVLTGKIKSDDSKRAYLKIFEDNSDKIRASAANLQRASEAYRQANIDNVVQRLRLAIAAREDAEDFIKNLLFSNALMFALTAHVQSHTAEDFDGKFVELLNAVGSFDAVSKQTLDNLLTDIQKRLEKDK